MKHHIANIIAALHRLAFIVSTIARRICP